MIVQQMVVWIQEMVLECTDQWQIVKQCAVVMFTIHGQHFQILMVGLIKDLIKVLGVSGA